jgi:ElaB/YqjD/DUF883 family membrane-anchored ribosome-binding protein
MGEDPGTDGTAVTQERAPQEIRREIEETRRELGDTVASLAVKADVKAQAKHKVEATKASATEKKHEWAGKVKQASPRGAAATATVVSHKARENPLPLIAAGAFLLGLLVGRARK